MFANTCPTSHQSYITSVGCPLQTDFGLQVKGVVPDRLLVQLLTAWLSPSQAVQSQIPKPKSQAATCTTFNPRNCCKAQLGIAVLCAEDCAKQMHKKITTSGKERPPLQEITYIHAAIRYASSHTDRGNSAFGVERCTHIEARTACSAARCWQDPQRWRLLAVAALDSSCTVLFCHLGFAQAAIFIAPQSYVLRTQGAFMNSCEADA